MAKFNCVKYSEFGVFTEDIELYIFVVKKKANRSSCIINSACLMCWKNNNLKIHLFIKSSLMSSQSQIKNYSNIWYNKLIKQWHIILKNEKVLFKRGQYKLLKVSRICFYWKIAFVELCPCWNEGTIMSPFKINQNVRAMYGIQAVIKANSHN